MKNFFKKKLDKNFVRRLVKFNKSYKERLGKFEPIVKFFTELKETEISKNPEDVETLSKLLDEYMDLLDIEMKDFEAKEYKNFKKLDKWLKKNRKDKK
jgi:hypothetical protein